MDSKMPKTLVIFDCDGVLRSASWKAIYKAYQVILKRYEKHFGDFFQTQDEFQRWFDFDWIRNLERLGLPCGNESEMRKINKIFHAFYDPFIYTFPWVDAVASELSSRYTVTILSTSLSASVRKSLDGTSEKISMIVGCDNVKNIKPHPEGIELIMRQMGAAAENTIMIGDTEVDVEAGKRAGVMTIGVTWGLRDKSYLESLSPDVVLEDPDDLLLL